VVHARGAEARLSQCEGEIALTAPDLANGRAILPREIGPQDFSHGEIRLFSVCEVRQRIALRPYV
jgi:hypothetical protein